MAQIFMDLIYSITHCLPCLPGSPQLKINNRSFKILRLLGEGGYSYVYLVQETSTSQLYALKKIRCPFGQESVSQALREVEAYALFAPHPNIIRALDHDVAADDPRHRADDPASSKTVYILLPYYRRGNLQDAINANLVNHTVFPERRLVALFLGVARALRAMHQYRVRRAPDAAAAAASARQKGRGGAAAREAAPGMRADRSSRSRTRGEGDDVEHEPLMEGEMLRSHEGAADGEMRPYAHRDITPGNIMIADDGKTPILMDLGSIAPAPTAITSRALALAVQDAAAQHSTMPYRAPELFDVKTGSIIDTKVDVWSLGCTLYACLVGKSPFEARSDETGGSLSICVLGGDWRFPGEGRVAQQQQMGKGRMTTTATATATNGAAGAAAGATTDGPPAISEGVKEVVRRCLKVEPAERPDVDELIAMLEALVEELPADEEGE